MLIVKNKMKKTWAIIAIVSALLLGAVVGYFWGARKCEYEVVREEVRYVTRPSTTITHEWPKPVTIRSINLPHLHYTDTIYKELRLPADTASIIADYIRQREYDLDFSTDTTGTFKVHALVSHNRLASASATIAPLQREIERVVYASPRKLRPIIGVGAIVGNELGLSVDVGAMINDQHVVQAFYMRLDRQNYYGARYSIVFGKR